MSFQVSGLDISVEYQKIKPKGKMTQEEMITFVGNFGKLKKISANWKTKLVDDDAWKIDTQEPSPVKNRFDSMELPMKKQSAEK